MSTAFFCSSLPATPFGHKDGRGTTDRVRTPAIVRLPANPSAQACRLKRWNKYRCSADGPAATAELSTALPSLGSNGGITKDPSKPSPAQSAKKLAVEIDKDFGPFLLMHKTKDDECLKGVERLGRFNRINYVDASEVISKDVVIDPVTKLTVRIYLPPSTWNGSIPERIPVLVYFHGGAFIVEDVASPPYHNYLNKLAEKAGILIVSVNYRLAPEHLLPAAYNDCKAALNWVVSQTDENKHERWIAKHGNLDHLFLSGDSAGGNITHNIAIDPDTTGNIEGIALIHPYFFGKVPEETELQDPISLLFHRKLWSFIAPDSKEGLDDLQVNPLGPTAESLNKTLDKVKGRRAVVFVAGEDFHSERAKRYNKELTKALGEKVWQICDHEGVGHVYHLSADKEIEKIESEEAWKKLTDLLKLFKDNEVDLELDELKRLKDKTEEAIRNMKKTERAMADTMMRQLVAFFKDKKDDFDNADKAN